MKSSSLVINNRTFTWGARTYVMGIINVTEDSFSGDGILRPEEKPPLPSPDGAALAHENTAFSETARQRIVSTALAQARGFVAAGADFLDVGGESTRPGSQPVSAEQEMERVLPVIHALSAEFDLPISIDTYKAPVAEAALQAGAAMINDVWGLRVDPDLAGVAAEYETPLILMHNRSSWAHAEIKERLGGRYVGMQYDDLLEDIRRDLMESVALAHAGGVADEQIILDPGIGFGKTVEQNLELIDRLEEIRSLGYPVLLGPSRKSFIGFTLDLPPDQRVEGTAAAVAVGIARRADIVRVHDVPYMVRVAKMADAIVRRH
jgi:dihydropteroate synthase